VKKTLLEEGGDGSLFSEKKKKGSFLPGPSPLEEKKNQRNRPALTTRREAAETFLAWSRRGKKKETARSCSHKGKTGPR